MDVGATPIFCLIMQNIKDEVCLWCMVDWQGPNVLEVLGYKFHV